MSDRRSGWLLVIVSGALAIVVCVLAYGQVKAQGILQGVASAGEAAVALLIAAAPGILMVVALDVIAFFVGKDLWVRIVAAAIAVLTVVGVLVAGVVAAESTDPPASAYWAAAGNDPGPFDCVALNSDMPAEMQAALDELEHPWPVDIYFAANDSCAAMLRDVPTDQVIDDYSSELEKAGWAIDTQDEGWLYADRGHYTLVVSSCYFDEPETIIGIFVDGDIAVSCESPSP